MFRAKVSNSDGMLSWLGVAQDGHWLPPREVVVRQSWTFRETSGVFSISYHSVDHPDAPAPSLEGWTDYLYHWRSPVRAKARPSFACTSVVPGRDITFSIFQSTCCVGCCLVPSLFYLQGLLQHFTVLYGLRVGSWVVPSSEAQQRSKRMALECRYNGWPLQSHH